MTSLITRPLITLFAVLAAALSVVISAHGQVVSDPRSQSRDDDVVRVNTELVQTDVMVFDKKGRFVDQLTPDQFQLVVDNKPQSIAFFERVTSRRPNDSAAKTAATDGSSPKLRGRIVLFFVDDLHLAPDSLVRTRQALLEFINRGVSAHDLVAITSSSGQIGFLQQFTDDKIVLQSAVARLKYRANPKVDMDSPPMSDYLASRIRDGDESVIGYFVGEVMKQNCFKAGAGDVVCMVNPQGARNLVLERARQIVTQSSPETENTLDKLQGLMRTAAQLPGRKLVFVVSDGFNLYDRQTGSREKIKRITDAAGRAGVVIFTLDARGITTDQMDAANTRPQFTGASVGEITSSQDGLNALARDTGGLAFRNTNLPMNEWLNKILDETANYYLLAWRPNDESQKGRKFNHLEVSIKDRPDLVVRQRRGYFRTTPLPMLTTKSKPDKDPTKIRENDMRTVIDAPLTQRDVPVELSLDFSQVPGVGTKIMAAVRIAREPLTYDLFDGKQAAEVDIGGIVYDDKGKPRSSFVGRLRILAASEKAAANAPAVYSFQAWLPGGLYQVRVGLRDVRSGKLGSAMQWIKIPSLN